MTTEPFISVALPSDSPSNDYSVDCELVSATDLSLVGVVIVYDKATNGFKIKFSGSADNVVIRWTLHNNSY